MFTICIYLSFMYYLYMFYSRIGSNKIVLFSLPSPFFLLVLFGLGV
jgi:hypothetical protein